MRTKEGNKRQAITEAAIREFAERGFHQAKISRIADNAGVATGSVYLYFRNKENLLQEIFIKLWQEISSDLQGLVNRTDLNSLEKLEGMIDLVVDKFIDNSPLALVFVNEQHHLSRQDDNVISPYYDKFLELGNNLLTNGISEGLVNPNINTDIARHFIFGGVRHLIHLWAQDSRRYPLNKIRQEVKLLIKKGILK